MKNFKVYFLIFASFFSLCAVCPAAAVLAAEQPADLYSRAVISRVAEEGVSTLDGQTQEYQKLELEILSGSEKGKNIALNNGLDFIVGIFQKYSAGEKVVLAKSSTAAPGQKDVYYIVDRYRVPNIFLISLIFFALAIYFGRRRGFMSIVGMLFSVFIIFYFIIPRIATGSDPFLTCVAGAIVIILLSLYLSHGFNRRTTVALISTLLSLGLAVLIDLLFVHLAQVSGSGSEEAFYLQFDNFTLNLRGLLLGGIILGVLGILDDVTTGQAAAVEEIFQANRELSFSALYKSGLSVGREHIASLINTLVLAYVGASFPLLILYSTQRLQPLWVILNSNFIAEEIVRTLVGSSALVLAVPLTTFLAAFFYTRKRKQ